MSCPEEFLCEIKKLGIPGHLAGKIKAWKGTINFLANIGSESNVVPADFFHRNLTS